MKHISECPECESGNTGRGPAMGDLANVTVASSCHSCGCEWVIHLKPDMLTVTTTGERLGGGSKTTVEDFDVIDGEVNRKRPVLYSHGWSDDAMLRDTAKNDGGMEAP